VAEWGNPVRGDSDHLDRKVGRRTRGTETSQYPEEEKSTERLLVAASERGLVSVFGRARAETVLLVGAGLQDPRMVTETPAEVPWNGPPERVRAP
jgi:hypothetical protein